MNGNENMDMEKQENGQITYANEVIATIVSVATTEVQGISGISGAGAISGILGKGKSPRGVKVDMSGGSVKVDISVTVDYGIPIQKVGRNVQENVRKSIETMTGLHVDKVDLHVVGVSFEKENQEIQLGQKLAMSLEGDKEHAEEKDAAAPADEELETMPEDEAIEDGEDSSDEDESGDVTAYEDETVEIVILADEAESDDADQADEDETEEDETSDEDETKETSQE